MCAQRTAETRLPTGTVTFVLTDIEGSSRLWESHREAMGDAIALHHSLIDDVVVRYSGARPQEQGEGDSTLAAFERASDAIACALDVQRTVAATTWPGDIELKVRIGVLTGEAQLRDGRNYAGAAVNRCARLRDIANGGQTLVSRSTFEVVADAFDDVSFRDLGDHRLRDLTRPEHVFELCHADLPQDIPAPRSLDAVPNNLPTVLTSFIGREKAIAEVTGLLGGTRALTLTGPGGVGKTRLALQVAADFMNGFPYGIWFVDLAPVADSSAVARGIGAGVGLREAQRPDGGEGEERGVLEKIVARLRAGSTLLVLDNCEHVVDECARVAQALLEQCPHLTVLATSREPLGIAGETTWIVPSLTLPEVEDSESMRLFVERARLRQPDFALTTFNAPAVSDICLRLDGIPLAIELAAARVRTLSPAQIAERLDDRFRLLTSAGRTILPRQQTLRAMVDWSYELLGDTERELLARLSVFAGGFTLEAAERVCAGDGVDASDVVDLLGSLVDRSIVDREAREDRPRYRLLETIREYAWERLNEEPGLLEEAPDDTAAFRREGDFWTIVFDGRTDRLAHAKGFDYLKELLSRPGREVHALDLVAPDRPKGADGDAGDVIDAEAREAYKHRLTELAEDIEDARANNDTARAERLQSEHDAIVDELSAALGLGGRARKAASGAERARVSVTKAVKSALRRIASANASLGEHLERTVHTGVFCSYTPDPRVPVRWQV